MALSIYSRWASPRFPLRLALSYVADWIVIIGIAAIGAGLSKLSPYHRPFSPVNPELSYPHVNPETVSTPVLAVVALIAPAIITLLVSLILVPGPTAARGTPKDAIWRQKAWELNTAWMGLGLALATTLFFTEGMKNLFGKPRPDLLARCNLDPATVQQYALGGFGDQIPEWNLLISYTACRETDMGMLKSGFKSFPSGHSSLSWAGMLYLALYLCSKFAVTIPYLLPYQYTAESTTSAFTPPPSNTDFNPQTSLRKQAATPPAWTYIFVLVPFSVAIYVCSTRYTDFRHYGFDIIFGALLGIVCSWTSFRLYHLPIRRGAGWSWGPRSADRAWWIGVGVAGYAGQDGSEHKKRDVESADGSRGTPSADEHGGT